VKAWIAAGRSMHPHHRRHRPDRPRRHARGAGALFDKRIDGFSVIFHQVSYQTVGLSTLQSRATAGMIDGVFVFCLPGSNGAVRDGWDKVIAGSSTAATGPATWSS
jgi:molybdopterin biosynthesis enzyme MoaB